MNMSVVHAFATDLRAADASLFLLVDPLAEVEEDNPLQLEALRANLGDEAVVRLSRSDLAHTPDFCPALVTLAAPGEEPSFTVLNVLADQIRREARQERRYICGLLSSRASAEDVAARVLSLGQLPTEKGSTYFPVHEPLRLELLSAALEDDQHDLWWPIEHWLYPHSSGAISVINAKPGGNDAPGRVAAAMQIDADLIAMLLGRWRRIPRSPLPYPPAHANSATPLPPHAAMMAYAQLQQARKRGLVRDDDLLVLALFQLNIHQQLQRHVRVSKLIDTAIAGQISLGDLFKRFTDRDWERVVSDLINEGIQP